MHAALDQGAIPKKIKAIPNIKLSRELKSLSELFIPTENIIRGMLNKSTITLPIEKFVLFNKFIEAEIGSVIVLLFSIPLIIFSVVINNSDSDFNSLLSLLFGIALIFLGIAPWSSAACIRLALRNK